MVLTPCRFFWTEQRRGAPSRACAPQSPGQRGLCDLLAAVAAVAHPQFRRVYEEEEEERGAPVVHCRETSWHHPDIPVDLNHVAPLVSDLQDRCGEGDTEALLTQGSKVGDSQPAERCHLGLQLLKVSEVSLFPPLSTNLWSLC